MNGVLARVRHAWRMAQMLAPVIFHAEPATPEGEAFPKRIFQLDPRDSAVPGGRTADYARLSRRLWMRTWAADPALSPQVRWHRIMHLEVLRAQELEARLLAELETEQ